MLDEFEYSDVPVVFCFRRDPRSEPGMTRWAVGAGDEEKFVDIPERKYLRFILNALYLYIIMYI